MIYPVSHALPMECSQLEVYHRTVRPMLLLFLEGADASVITYGQTRTGKSYTLSGLGIPDNYQCEGEFEGVIQRSVKEIFLHLTTHLLNRNFIINIGWIEIGPADEVRDLLGAGIVQCRTLNETFQWLQIGWRNLAQNAVNVHNMFTLTLEQHWTTEGRNQHRLSTVSFCDLAASCKTTAIVDQRPILVQRNPGLQALENVVNFLAMDPTLHPPGIDPQSFYQSSVLTTLLRDSFGGRAQTILFVCVSAEEEALPGTHADMQFAMRAQCIRNFVTVNAFMENTHIPDIIPPLESQARVAAPHGDDTDDNDEFGRHHNRNDTKLIVSAREIFNRLLVKSSNLSSCDRLAIEEWLYMQAECDDYLDLSELNSVHLSRSHLGPIHEAEEMSDDLMSENFSGQQNTTTDSESEYQRADIDDKMVSFMAEFQDKTDEMFQKNYSDYLKAHPKPIFESIEISRANPEPPLPVQPLVSRGRSRSILPGETLSSVELEMLQRVAAKGGGDATTTVGADKAGARNADVPLGRSVTLKRWQKVSTDIEATVRQIRELEQTLALKQELMVEFIKGNDARTTARHRFNKKKAKLENEYERAKKHLSKAIVHGKDKAEIDRLKVATGQLEKRLQDLASIKHIATESGQSKKKLEQSIQESRRECEVLQKQLKKERKLKEALDAELDTDRQAAPDDLVVVKYKNLKVVDDRLSHLNQVLKEKAENLERCQADDGNRDSLRHEIRNLRRTKDHLLDKRCVLERKLKREKMLTHTEERKLLECDEAIEAIDAAMEFKNELICGRKSIDTQESLQRERGEQMLMARLNKLSEEEMRTLLYKYFLKVIDLRESGRKLEIQLLSIERERDAWEWRERMLSHEVRQARLEGERTAVFLQKQHETKFTLMLRHLASETRSSAGGLGQEEATLNAVRQQQELELYKHRELMNFEHGNRDTTRYGGKFKQEVVDERGKSKERTNNKLFAKFQVLTRYSNEKNGKNYATAGPTGAGAPAPGRLMPAGHSGCIVPTHNLRQLQTNNNSTSDQIGKYML